MYICLNGNERFMKKKEIKIYQSFEELNAEQLRKNIEMTLQERWDAFWDLRKLHDELFGRAEEPTTDDGKKRIIISKPDWL